MTNDQQFKVTNEQSEIVRDVKHLNDLWEGAIPQCMTATD